MSTPKDVQIVLFENGANWRWAVGHGISDPALWVGDEDGRGVALVSELEVALMRAVVDPARTDVMGFDAARKALGDKFGMVKAAVWLVQRRGGKAVRVPRNFPAGLFEQLKAEGAAAGVGVEVAKEDLVFPSRARKTAAEIGHLRAIQAQNGAAMNLAREMLAVAKVRADGVLELGGEMLTSARVRTAMNQQLLAAGCTEFRGGPIVTCGAEAAMPHARGEGLLRAGELIIIDTFPRGDHGYWGDLTRTFIKGQPSAWQQNVYDAVLGAQERALAMLAPGVDGQSVHTAVAEHLAAAGFATGVDAEGNPYGFFHGTGHGVGLELHEPGPRMLSKAPSVLEVGFVTSVEPGLYYANQAVCGGVGGCRIEDVAVVLERGCEVIEAGCAKSDWVV